MAYDQFLSMERPPSRPGGVDPTTGWRYEEWHIGMVRNAPERLRRWLRVYLDPAPHVVLSQNVPLRGWYKSKHEPPGKRPRPCYTEALLTQPYGGACPVRCLFCYVNNGLRGYRSQGVTVVDPRYPEKVQKQLGRMRTAAAFYISSFTEPFQPGLEPHYHNTERLSRVAVNAGLPLFYLTRQLPPDWAWDALRANPYSYIQFSINTPDPDQWKRLSPNAAPLESLLNAVALAHELGIYVSIQVNPIMPGITTMDEVAVLIHLLAKAGADHLIFKHVEIVSPAAKAMVAKVHKAFPDRAGAFEALFTETIGHLRTVMEDYRVESLERYSVECKSAGVTMGLCYEYAFKRDRAGRILDKAGVSLGPRFQTADQCHGRRVPVFSRAKVTDPWVPIPDCHPGGCLYCEENAGGPCGNPNLVKAPALRPADLLEPAWTLRHGRMIDKCRFISKVVDGK